MILEQGLPAGLMVVVICIIAVFLILIAGAVIVVLKPDLIKKMSKGGEAERSGNSSDSANRNVKIGDTKEYLPYERILDYCIDLGGYNYRAIIDVSSLNYGLMSGTEQQMVDATYRSFLDALDFPIELYIQTREFDTQAVLNDLEERAKSAVKKYPNLRQYAEEYMYEMSGITKRFGNTKTKKKYVIVSFNQEDLQDVSELSKDEINSFAQEELMQRVSIVLGGLRGIGLSAELLEKKDIASVLYSYYHRDNFRIAEDIVSGNLTSLVVNGPDHRTDARYNLDNILTNAQNRIRDLVVSNTSDEELKLYKYIIGELDRFKQDDIPLDMAHLFYNTKEAAEREGFVEDYYRYVKTHPETKFWNMEEEEVNYNKVTIPEEISSQVATEDISGFKAQQDSLSSSTQDFGDQVGEFDPNALVNQQNRKGKKGRR